MIPAVPLLCYSRIPSSTVSACFTEETSIASSWTDGRCLSALTDVFTERSEWLTDFYAGPQWCGIIGLIVKVFV